MQKWFMIIVFILLAACQPATVPVVPTSTFSGTLPPLYSPTISTDSEVKYQLLNIQLAWEKSPHAVQSQNDPLKTDGAWQITRCDNCHESKGGIIGATIAWWDPETQAYESVPDSNTLCQKCHEDILAFSHQEASNSLVHQSFECFDCHEPHSTAASCSNSTCHANILQIDDQPPSTPVGGHPDVGNPFCGGPGCHPAATQAASKPHSGHSFTHAGVTCVACHDASELQVGPDQIRGLWVTWRIIVEEGSSLTEPFSSHSIQLIVDCKRCHFSDNPWNLPIAVGNEFGN
jgi:hypothetical protein